MVKNLILAGALIMCLAHTEALTDNDECRFEDKYFTLSNIKSNKNQDTTCQEDCAKMNYCLLWQYDGSNSCTLTVLYAYTMNHGTSKSGITNCNSGDVASCGEKQIVDTISGTRVDGIDSKKACEEKCLDLQNCLLWRFATEGGERRCFLQQYTLKDAIESTFGVSNCSTQTTTPTPTTSTPTTTTPERPECSNYKQLDDKSRSIKYSGSAWYCDAEGKGSMTSPGWVGESWYRMPEGTRIAGESPGSHQCGTSVPGYLKGTHPTTPGESLDNAKFCFGSKNNNCVWSTIGSITHCAGAFMVYKLKDAPTCAARYCTIDQS